MKNYTDFKVGDKVLVKENYITGGGEAFQQAMRLWRDTPTEIVEVSHAWRSVMVLRPGTVNGLRFSIQMSDLIPFRPKNIFNK